MNGNTAPYLLYAYARIRGIQRKGLASAMHQQPQGDGSGTSVTSDDLNVSLNLGTKAELQLAKHIIRFHEVLLEVERTFLPNKVCLALCVRK